MIARNLATFVVGAALGLAMLFWQAPYLPARQPAGGDATSNSAQNDRFEFEVVESFDAQYLGDTPGHRGRNGGLNNRRPRLALGDAVYRGDEKIGNLTRVTWDRARGSLELEFDPAPLARINVGDVVWVALDGSQAKDE